MINKNAVKSEFGAFIKKGFTLLELLVVVLIIGILASIALPQYKMAVGKVRFATLKENAHVIKGAMDRYYMMHGNFTQNFEVLDIGLGGEISNSKSYIALNDGSICDIGNVIITCKKNIFNIRMEYGIRYDNFQGARGCYAYSDKLTDIPNRICQQETGKTAPTGGSENAGYYSYQY